MTEELVGVILSAGKGTRIDPFNTQYPKPLLPIGNLPILAHHMEAFRRLGIRKVYVVVAHLMDRIINHFGRHAHGLDISYVEQPQILGIAHAVGRVEALVQGPFMLALGDIFYLAPDLERMVERYREGDVAAVLAVKEEISADPVRKNFTVDLAPDGTVSRVVEKPINPTNLLKGCGIYLFGPEIFDAIHRTPRTALRDEYEITTAIQLMIDAHQKVVADAVIDWDLNVTFPKDLLEGNLRYLKHLGIGEMVAESAVISEQISIENCVIGADVELRGQARLRDCVLLPGTQLSLENDLHRSIVSKDLLIQC